MAHALSTDGIGKAKRGKNRDFNLQGSFTPITPDNFEEYLQFSSRDMRDRLRQIDHHLRAESSYDDVRSLIDLIDAECRIGMDDIERQMFAMHLFKLKDVVRYRGDIHLAPDQFGNVAEHSCKVTVLADLKFQKAIEKLGRKTENLAHMRRNYAIRTFMHDLGEIAIEFRSFAEETKHRPDFDKDLEARMKADQLDLEEDIARFVSYVALYAAFTDDPDLYFEAVDGLRTKIEADQKKGLVKDYFDAAKDIRSYIDGFKYPKVDPNTEKEIQERVDGRRGYMRYYQHAERYLGVGGPAVKQGQINEGNMRFVEMAAEFREDAVPYEFSTSARMCFAYIRSEKGLSEMFRQAVDGPEQEVLSEITKEETYEILIEHLAVGAAVINRNLKDPDPEPAEGLDDRNITDEKAKVKAELEQRESTEAKQDDFRNNAADILARDTISAKTMLLLYTAAWLNTDFAPSDTTPLMMQRAVPDALVPYFTILGAVYDTGKPINKTMLAQLRKDYTFTDNIAYKDILDRLSDPKTSERVDEFFAVFRHYRGQSQKRVEQALKAA